MALAIADYSTYIDLLQAAPRELVSLCLQVPAAVAYLLIAGLWLPAFLLMRGRQQTPAPLDAPPSRGGRWAHWLALSVAGGVISSVTFWTLSLFVFKQTGPGTVGVVALALFGLVLTCRSSIPFLQLGRHLPSAGSTGSGHQRVSEAAKDANASGGGRHAGSRDARRAPAGWPVIAVTVVAFGMGFWHLAATELRTGDRVWFSDRHKDLSVHMHAASVIAASGLPRLHLTGSPAAIGGLSNEPYSSLAHTGYAVLTAGFRDITGMSLYRAAVSLWIVGYLTIGWSALALVERFQLSRFACFVSGIAPLIWAQARWPAISVMLDPSEATSYPQHPYAATMMYHNFPHVWSIALVAAGLLCLDLSSRPEGKKTLALAMATLAIVVSGWIKPSQAILFGPALLIYLLLERRRAIEFIVVLFVLGLGMLVYFLPALLEDLPSHPSWSVSPSREKLLAATRFFALGLGAGLLFVAARLRGLWKNRKSGLGLDWGDTVLIAAGGGWLFAVLFSELRFEQRGPQEPNIWWGLSGCLVLFSPYVIAWCGNRSVLSKRGPSPAWLRRPPLAVRRAPLAVRWSACGVVGMQLLGGLVLATTYPLINLRSHRVSMVQALQEAGRATPPGTTFYVDPGSVLTMPGHFSYTDQGLAELDLVSYLARPVSYLTAMSTEAEIDEVRVWRAFVRTGDARFMEVINRRSAIILHETRSAARTTLLNHGWVLSRELPGHYELFENQLR